MNNRYWIEDDGDKMPLAYRDNIASTEPFIKESLLDEIKSVNNQYKNGTSGSFAEAVYKEVVENLIITLDKKGG